MKPKDQVQDQDRTRLLETKTKTTSADAKTGTKIGKPLQDCLETRHDVETSRHSTTTTASSSRTPNTQLVGL